MTLSNSHLRYPHVDPLEVKVGSHTLLVVPSIHNRLEYSDCVRRNITGVDRVLLELPAELADYFQLMVGRLPIPTVLHQGLPEKAILRKEDPVYIAHPGDSVFYAAMMASRLDIPYHLIDTWTGDLPNQNLPIHPDVLPYLGWESFLSSFVPRSHAKSPHLRRTKKMVEKALSFRTGKSLLVCGLAHIPFLLEEARKKGGIHGISLPEEIGRYWNSDPPDPRTEFDDWDVSDIHPHSMYLVMGDFPYIVGKFAECPTDGAFSYEEEITALLFDAHTAYRTKFSDTISTASFKRMLQFLRNQMYLQGNLRPSIHQILTSASGMSDGDYVFEVYRTLISYPYLPSERSKLPSQTRFIPDEDAADTIKFTFKRRLHRTILKRRSEDDDPWEELDPIPEEEYPGHWQEIWEKYSPFGTVSYPPEDEYIESYFGHLRKKAQEILAEERSTVEEFKTSIEDGIDWPETIKNYHERKIYVRKIPRIIPDIGALIVQFEEEQGKEYANHSVLYAEHEKESDISLVTTNPSDVIVGPGIARIKIAAVVAVFPPTGYGIGIPRGGDSLKTRLLYTAMNMARGKVLVLVSRRPPSPDQRHFVQEYGFRLVYLPMQQLTKAALHRLRTMHLLAFKELREIARQYIGF